MKLYFYSLKRKLEVTECEAVEKGQLLRPKEGYFPVGIGDFIVKNDIGKVKVSRWGYTYPYIVLNEDNIKKAKQLLIEEYIDVRIEKCQQRIAELEEKRKVIEEAK